MNLKKRNFFDTDIPEEKETVISEEHSRRKNRPLREQRVAPSPEVKKEKIRFIDHELKELIEAADQLCRQQKQSGLSSEVDLIKRYVQSMKFTVTVVGEFSRGKSTLINKLIGDEIMPVGNLPTTAMLTKITYNDTPMLVHINEKGRKTQLTLAPESWDGLTADLYGNDAKGVVYAGLPDQWLLTNDMEFIDTPGAGDLQDKRMEYVDQAIMTSDCAIITISAVNGISLTEKMFLEERIMTRQIPRIMLAVTKLDLVQKEERTAVLHYIKNKLKEWNLEVPIYITLEDMEGLPEGIGAGIGAMKGRLEFWAKDAGHLIRKNRTAYAALDEIVTLLQHNTETKLSIYDMEESKRKDAAAKQKELIRNNELRWEDLQTQMLMRCNNNFEWMHQVITEKQEAVIERIRYELDRTMNPKEWWEKDYPYRLKMEMVALGAGLENGLQQLYTKDLAWLNNILENDYKTNILQEKEAMADKDLFKKWNTPEDIELTDIKKGRLISRIGTGVASAGGYLLFGAFGLSPLGAIVGVSGGIISEVFLNRNVETQKRKLADMVRTQVPKVIDQAVREVEQKLRKAYDSIIAQAKQKEAAWIDSRIEAIDSALAREDRSSEKEVREEYDKIMNLKSRIKITER